jgi:hypothetical protein
MKQCLRQTKNEKRIQKCLINESDETITNSNGDAEKIIRCAQLLEIEK